MSNRFDYVRYDDSAATKQAGFKNLFLGLEAFVEEHLQSGRAKALVFTKLEETYMWIGKAIRDEQVALRTAELEEVRQNG